MKLSQALDFFKNLIKKTNKKSDIKIYQSFIDILFNLKSRDLTEPQLKSIEKKLDYLNLSSNSLNRKKYFKRKITEFTTYLKKEFSFITEGYYTEMGIVFGMSLGSGIGLALGIAFGGGEGIAFGLPIGACFGMVMGLIIGTVKDAEAKEQKRVLK